ncbi:MAG: hypothetical protein QXR97_06485, partial [Thermoproteota archaeon]
RDDPARYGIGKDRKQDIEEYLSRQEKNLCDYIRGAFSNFLYYDTQGVKVIQVKDGSGYASGADGYNMLRHLLVNVLGRVKDEPLDPEYVYSYVWPAGAEQVNIRALFEQFYRRPGVIIPSTKDKFLETVKKGVENGIWILKRKDEVYSKNKLPKSISVDEYTELLTGERARRILEEVSEKPTGGLKEGIQEPGKAPGEKFKPPTLIELSESPVHTLAGDLEKRATRDRFAKIHRITLKISSQDASQLLEVKNLMTRLGPEKNCSIRLIGTITRSKAPNYTVSFDMSKDDAQKDEGKSILDNFWKLKGIDSLQVTLELSWSEPVKPEEAAVVLRTMGKEIVASLEASVGA